MSPGELQFRIFGVTREALSAYIPVDNLQSVGRGPYFFGVPRWQVVFLTRCGLFLGIIYTSTCR